MSPVHVKKSHSVSGPSTAHQSTPSVYSQVSTYRFVHIARHRVQKMADAINCRASKLQLQIYSRSVKVEKPDGVANSVGGSLVPVFNGNDTIEGKVILDPSCHHSGTLSVTVCPSFFFFCQPVMLIVCPRRRLKVPCVITCYQKAQRPARVNWRAPTGFTSSRRHRQQYMCPLYYRRDQVPHLAMPLQTDDQAHQPSQRRRRWQRGHILSKSLFPVNHYRQLSCPVKGLEHLRERHLK
jgi:hypothetical protein